MANTGDRLRKVQVNAHLQIDKIYAALAREIAAAILRRATPDVRGIPRLSLPSRAAILTDLGRLLDTARTDLLSAILPAIKAAEDAAMVGAEPLPRDIGAALMAGGETWRTLGTDRSSVIAQTGALLIRGIAGGQPAAKVAKVIKDYFSPWFSTYRSETGALLHRQRKGTITSWPGMAGAASQHARLVLLTQTTAAHGRTMRRIARRDDLALKWNLSPQHRHADICSTHANHDEGLGRGVFREPDFPKIPQHPRCRCYASTASLEAR